MLRLYIFIIIIINIIKLAIGLLPGALEKQKIFHYPDANQLKRQSSAHYCTICDSDDSKCLRMDNAMCSYYKETDEILSEKVTELTRVPENPALKAEVDDLLFRLTTEESLTSGECIPFVSHYTNCHKRNLNLDCRKCDCDAAGKWICTDVNYCNVHDALNVDHRVLVRVMENLNMHEANSHIRRKRSKNVTTTFKGNEKDELSSQEIMNLINGPQSSLQPVIVTEIAKNFTNDSDYEMLNNGWDESTEATTPTTTQQAETTSQGTDLDFEELYPEQSNATYIYFTKIHLPMLKKHTEDILDPEYMDTPDEDLKYSNDTNNTIENMLISQETSSEGLTQNNAPKDDKKMIFYSNFMKDITVANNLEATTSNDGVSDIIELNDIYDRQTVHVVKREIPAVAKNRKPSTLISDTKVNSIQHKVLKPLNNIIQSKRDELTKLDNILNNLMIYTKTDMKNVSFLNLEQRIINDTSKLNRRQDKDNDVERYEWQLRNDIYAVMSDVFKIERSNNFKKLSDELNILVQALKYYVHKEGEKHVRKELQRFTKATKNYSRKFGDTHNIRQVKANEIMKQILNNIDKDMPASNALSPLSLSANKILTRIIKKYYNDFTHLNIPFINVNDYITNNLKKIGLKWYKIIRNIAASPYSDRLFNMKLLYLEICRDICKVKNSLSVIQHIERRRTSIIDIHLTSKLASRIAEDIDKINKKLQEIIKLQNERYDTIKSTTKPKDTKISFLHHLKNTLKRWTNNIKKVFKDKNTKMLHGNTDNNLNNLIAKEIKNAKYEFKTVFARRKRSMGSKFTLSSLKRIRNIIPNYLKGKINIARYSKLKTVSKN